MHTQSRKRVIYDFGANNGDDTEYYLKKADLVIAVEANPLLANAIRSRFSDAIAASKLVVEACILSDGITGTVHPFYIHKTNHVMSQFPRPEASRLSEFEEVQLPSKNVIDLVEQHGDPYYVKIDVEHFDQAILELLFSRDIRPPFISAESHSIEIFSTLVSQGKYDCFNLVDGRSVERVYKNAHIETTRGEEVYSFPRHSAGPFGADISSPWMTANNFFLRLAFEGLGWKDVHATNAFAADPNVRPQLCEIPPPPPKRKSFKRMRRKVKRYIRKRFSFSG